jgi:hypothetical protein
MIHDTISINGPPNKKQYIYINENVYKEGNGYTIHTTITVSDKKDELLEKIGEKNKEFNNKYNSLSLNDQGIVDAIIGQQK